MNRCVTYCILFKGAIIFACVLHILSSSTCKLNIFLVYTKNVLFDIVVYTQKNPLNILYFYKFF